VTQELTVYIMIVFFSFTNTHTAQVNHERGGEKMKYRVWLCLLLVVLMDCQAPAITSTVTASLSPQIILVDGPVQADSYTWWKFKLYSWDSSSETTGWAVEDQD
jgi:hypothetical protein